MTNFISDSILPANPAARKFAAEFFNYLSTAATDCIMKLDPNPVRLMPGGLEKIVPEGFRLRGGDMVTERSSTEDDTRNVYMRRISAENLVYWIV